MQVVIFGDIQMAARKLTPKQVKTIKILTENYGNVTEACIAMEMSRGTHYLWMSRNEHYKKEVDNLNEGLLDRAESILMGRLSESDTALIFFLKTKGKSRGYVERIEQEIKGDITVKGYDEFFTS